MSDQAKLEQLETKLASLKGYSVVKNPQKDFVCVAAVETDLEDGSTEMSYLRVKITDVENDMVLLHLFCILQIEKCFFC